MAQQEQGDTNKSGGWRALFAKKSRDRSGRSSASASDVESASKRPETWSMGILNDRHTEEVPGSVLLLSKVSEYNEPLGLQHAPARTSASSLPSPYPESRSSIFSRRSRVPEKKRTADGKIILEPQPTDSANDPLNWPVLRRDLALFSLGFYCMVGGGMTPILAAGFSAVANDLDVTVPQVALTTGLYMMGLGLGSVVLSPTAILYGKRPVYLAAALAFVVANIWCALSPTFASLVVARVFMGFAVSSVECLPSASIAEIYFLHEKAYRLGIYTLLLLGGKNLIPLVSAAIIQSLGWRWVFWIVAMVVGFAGVLLFLFVPETFWDRNPKPRGRTRTLHVPSLTMFRPSSRSPVAARSQTSGPDEGGTIAESSAKRKRIHFETEKEALQMAEAPLPQDDDSIVLPSDQEDGKVTQQRASEGTKPASAATAGANGMSEKHAAATQHLDLQENQTASTAPGVAKGSAVGEEQGQRVSASDNPDRPHDGQTSTQPGTTTPADYFAHTQNSHADSEARSITSPLSTHSHDLEASRGALPSPGGNRYTKELADLPQQSFVQQLRPHSGRLTHDSWFRVMLRPFILYAYPSILWSALVYALSVGWLIVLSESVSTIYENRSTYNFTPLQVGLVYISPFIGGILGTAVAGKVSDLIVRFLARKNGGVYEPEFRLFMALPIAVATVIGLMGYGWSVDERDHWIVPTIFFGFISFGCSLGSTTAITFAVDSYRQYAGEALVTLNFTKNIFHGLVWSLFFNRWLNADGSKVVFVAIGGIQLACLLTTIPMYIFGKRGRMWTVRRKLMEKF